MQLFSILRFLFLCIFPRYEKYEHYIKCYSKGNHFHIARENRLIFMNTKQTKITRKFFYNIISRLLSGHSVDIASKCVHIPVNPSINKLYQSLCKF